MNNSDYSQIMLIENRTNHLLHIALSIFTLSAWLYPYILITAINLSKRNKIRRANHMPIENRFPIFFAWFCTAIFALEVVGFIMVLNGQI